MTFYAVIDTILNKKNGRQKTARYRNLYRANFSWNERMYSAHGLLHASHSRNPFIFLSRSSVLQSAQVRSWSDLLQYRNRPHRR